MALLLGLLIANLIVLPRWLDAGFRVEFYIKVGIVLLGATLPFTLIIWAGPVAILQASIVSIMTFLVIFFVGRRLGLDHQLSATLGAGGAVCGVSAAIAVAAAVRAKKEYPPIAITLVIFWAILWIFALPLVSRALQLPTGVGGAWIGTSEFADAAGFAAAQSYGGMAGPGTGISGTADQAIWAYTLIKVVGRDVWIGIWAFVLAIVSVTRWEKSETGRKAEVGQICDEAAVSAFIRKLPYAARTKHNIRTKLSQFLNYCRREGKWITANPTENVKVRVRNGEEVKILTVPEVRQLLDAASNSELPASVIPYLAVQLFGGLRPFEAAQLRWERIHFETHQIEVLGETSKTRETRFVQMEQLLVKWLLPFRAQAGLITGPFFAETLRAVKVSAGFTFGDDKTNPWPTDVLRHCYGSYWLAVHRDRAHLAELMGNSLEVIKAHYRRAVPQPVAQAFWKLEPMPEAPGKIIPMDNVMDSMNEFPSLKFKFAKTMAHANPHFYVVRSAENNAEYEQLFHRIALEGVWEEWKDGRQYKYLSLGGWRYWAMTEDITQSKVINRARAS